MSEPILVYPDPPPALLVQTLDLGGYAWKAVGNAAVATANEPTDGWGGAIIVADTDPEGALSLCRTLRKRDAVLEPLLMLVTGAQLGELGEREDLFDDFCLTPFHPQELVARAKALLRRARVEPDLPKLIRAGKLEVDLERHEVRHGKSKVQLRPKEFDLLALLARHPGRVFQRSELLDLVWGYDFPGYTRTVDVHVQQVREKLAGASITDPSIQTVWGVGYRLELSES